MVRVLVVRLSRIIKSAARSERVLIHPFLRCSRFRAFCTTNSSLVCQAIQQVNAQNHHQQTNRHNNEERKSEPTQDHCAGADTAPHTAVTEVLCDLRSCH